MVESDSVAYVEDLKDYGFRGPSSTESPEVAVVDQNRGFLLPCDWLEVDLWPIATADGRRFGVTVAWLRGEAPTTLAAPPGWIPGGMDERVPADEFEKKYEFVEARDNVETYRHRDTGKVVYVGRYKGVPQRGSELFAELQGFQDGLIGTGREQALMACYERAEQLVEDTADSQEVWPHMLHGIASRLLNRWDKAEQAFRKATELNPDFIDAWLELTWSLASLGRLEEAEACARRALKIQPQGPAALGNLASVLLERGHADQVFPLISQALEIGPADSINQRILEQVCKARPAERPWYRRLWGNWAWRDTARRD